MLIVVEHFDTFHHYFLISVYPPLYLTLTSQLHSIRDLQAMSLFFNLRNLSYLIVRRDVENDTLKKDKV